MTKHLIYILSISFSILILTSCGSKENSQIEKLNTYIDEYSKIEEKNKDEFWPTFAIKKIKYQKEDYAKLLKDVNKINYDHLPDNQKINVDLLQLILEDKISNLNFETYKISLNSEGGFLINMLYDIQAHKIETEKEFENYQEKLSAIPAYFQERTEHLKETQAEGKSVPKVVVKNCIDIIDNWLGTKVESSFFVKPVTGNTEWQSSIQSLLSIEVIPAYVDLRNYLSNEYLPKAPEVVGVSNIKDGKAYYEQRVKYFTTFNITPQEIFDKGQVEVKRIKVEMDKIIADLGYDGTFEEFLEFLRTDPQFYAISGQELLNQAAWITKKMEGKLPQYFGKLPRMPLTVKPVPDAIAPTYTTGRYSPGSYADHRAGTYLVNTYKLESRPLYVLPALTLHEGVPGHHLQIMLAAEIDSMPEFRKNTYLSAFGEGWGLYAEYLGEEAGIYENPYEKFGKLTYEMWRACRLVVDPGMHYMGWTRQQAVDFMTANTALSIHEVNTEIDRYIGWPGQAVSYKIGELKIRELRQLAETELGEAFDIRGFHDLVLSNGSVPLKTLDRIVKKYIAKQKGLI